MITFLSSCSSSTDKQTVSDQNEEETTENKSIKVWTVEPTLEYDDIENWLTTRYYDHSTIDCEGASATSEWPLDDFSISYDRTDFYNSNGNGKFIIGSFEKGGGMVKKNGYWGLINSKGELKTQTDHKYYTYQNHGVVFNDAFINYDYSVTYYDGFGGGGTGASYIFMDKDGNIFTAIDHVTPNVLKQIDLFSEAVDKGYTKEDDFILLNTYASILDHDNYHSDLKIPENLIEAYVVIDKDGYRTLSIPRNYVVNDFSDGIISFAGCTTDPKDIVPDKTSEHWYFNYNAISMRYYAYELFCDQYNYKDYTFVNREGTIIASGFDDAYGFYEGYAAVKKNGKWGYIDKQGNIVIDFIFDKATAISDGSAWVLREGKAGRLNICELLNNNVIINNELLDSETVSIE